jgi:hypothetical protein
MKRADGQHLPSTALAPSTQHPHRATHPAARSARRLHWLRLPVTAELPIAKPSRHRRRATRDAIPLTSAYAPGTHSRTPRMRAHWFPPWSPRTNPRLHRSARLRTPLLPAATASLHTAGLRQFRPSTDRCCRPPPRGWVCRWRCRRTAANRRVSTRGTPREERRACPHRG